jgi:hypothetical protein
VCTPIRSAANWSSEIEFLNGAVGSITISLPCMTFFG